MRIAGVLRDWLNIRDARRMRRQRAFPEMIERHYWDRTEYARDHARLETLGYIATSRDETNPIVSATYPAAAGGVGGHLDTTVQRRVASIHVQYHRRRSDAES